MCLARGEFRPWPWDAPLGQGCSELRAAALALLYQNSSLGPWARAWGGRATGGSCGTVPTPRPSPAVGLVLVGGCRLARHVPAHLPVSVSFCQKRELHQPPHLLPTAGCLRPWGWGKQILLATGFSCSCRCCAWRSQSHARINVQSGGAGLMAGPHGSVGLHLDSRGWCLQTQARAPGSSQPSARHGKTPALGKLEAPFLWETPVPDSQGT